METFTRKQLIDSVQLFKEWHENTIKRVVGVLDIKDKVSKNDMAKVLYMLLTGETVPELITHRIERDNESGQVVKLLTEMLKGSDRFLEMESLKVYISKAFGTGWILITKDNAEINDPNRIRMNLITQVFEIKKEWLLRYLADMQITGISRLATNLIMDRKQN